MLPRHGNALLLVIGWENSKVKFHYQPGQENMGDYPSKHHTANIHQHVCPYYVHSNSSPAILPWALKPSIWQGCAVILGDPYAKKSPLLHIGVTSHLPVSPSIPYHRILGQFCLLNRLALPHTLSRRVPLE